MSLKARVDKLYTGKISSITSRITIKDKDKVIEQKTTGNNKKRMIEIVVRL